MRNLKTKEYLKALYAILVIGLTSVFSRGDDNNISNDENIVREKVAAYLKKENPCPYSFGVHPVYYRGNTWLCKVGLDGMQPYLPATYVVDRFGNVFKMSDDAAVKIINDEWPVTQNLEEQQQLIKECLGLTAGNCGYHKIINSLADIPSYTNKPLSGVAEKVIRPISNETVEAGTLWKFYTYQQIGGVANYYVFTFDGMGRLSNVKHEILGRDIGAAKYWE